METPSLSAALPEMTPNRRQMRQMAMLMADFFDIVVPPLRLWSDSSFRSRPEFRTTESDCNASSRAGHYPQRFRFLPGKSVNVQSEASSERIRSAPLRTCSASTPVMSAAPRGFSGSSLEKGATRTITGMTSEASNFFCRSPSCQNKL